MDNILPLRTLILYYSSSRSPLKFVWLRNGGIPAISKLLISRLFYSRTQLLQEKSISRNNIGLNIKTLMYLNLMNMVLLDGQVTSMPNCKCIAIMISKGIRSIQLILGRFALSLINIYFIYCRLGLRIICFILLFQQLMRVLLQATLIIVQQYMLIWRFLRRRPHLLNGKWDKKLSNSQKHTLLKIIAYSWEKRTNQLQAFLCTQSKAKILPSRMINSQAHSLKAFKTT